MRLTLNTEQAPKQNTNKIKPSRGHRLLDVVVVVMVGGVEAAAVCVAVRHSPPVVGDARCVVCASARLKKYKWELQQ